LQLLHKHHANTMQKARVYILSYVFTTYKTRHSKSAYLKPTKPGTQRVHTSASHLLMSAVNKIRYDTQVFNVRSKN